MTPPKSHHNRKTTPATTASWSRRTDEEQRGSSTTINVGDTYPKSNNDTSTASSDTYPKRNNDTTSTASSSATSNYFAGNPSPWLGSSSNTSMMNAAATSSSPTSASPCLSRKPLLLTTQKHGSDGNRLEGHHLPPSNWQQHEYTDQQQEDLLGVAKHHHHQLQEQEEAERTNYGTTTGPAGSSTGALLLQRNEVDLEHQKRIQGFPSLDAGIPKAHHAIDVMNSSDGDSNSTKNLQLLPHKPSYPYDSQSLSNISQSPRDIEKTSKEQAKEAIIEKMNAFFESKYNTQVSHKFPQKLFYIVDSGQYSHLIRWNDDGDAFQIKNVDSFVKGVLLQLFRQTKFESFHRKLNRWRFSKVRRQRHTWRHPFFQKGRLDLCTRIKEGSAWSSSALIKSNIKDDHINMKQEMFRNQQDQGALGIMNQSAHRTGVMIDRSNPTHLHGQPSSILPVANAFMPYSSASGAPSQQVSGNAYIPSSALNQHISNQPVLLSNTIQNNMQYNNNQSQPAINQWNFHQPTSFTDQSYIGANQERRNLTSTSNLGTTDYVAIPVQALMGNMPIGLLQNATGRIQEVHNVPFEVSGRQQSDMGLTAQNVDIQKEWEELPQEQGLNNRYNADGNFYMNHSTTTTAYPTQRDDNDNKIRSDQQAEK